MLRPKSRAYNKRYFSLAIASIGIAWLVYSPLKTRYDCATLVKQTIYKKVKLSGIYWHEPARRGVWTFHIASRLLFDLGLSFIEIDAGNYSGHELGAIGTFPKYYDRSRPYYRISFSKATSEYCAPFNYLTRSYRPFYLSSLIYYGLRPDDCVSIEPIASPSATFTMEETSTVRNGILYEQRQLIDRADGSVVAKNVVMSSEQMSDKYGGYVCENNGHASADFPWKAMEVVPTPITPVRYQVVEPETPIVFPKIGRVVPISEVLPVPPNSKFTDLRAQLNSVLENGSVTISGHENLQIVQGEKLKILRLGTVADQQMNYFLLRKEKGKLFMLGAYSFDKVAILQFTVAGEPIRLDFVPLPPLIRQSTEQVKRFELDIQPYGYDVSAYLVDNLEKVLAGFRLKVELY